MNNLKSYIKKRKNSLIICVFKKSALISFNRSRKTKIRSTTNRDEHPYILELESFRILGLKFELELSFIF